MATPVQNFQNHARMRPAYHYATFLPIAALMLWSGYVLFRGPSRDHVILFLLSFFLVVVALWARLFALGVQDRLIRLEERIRLERILPDDLRARIPELTVEQFIGLRFASDGEVADLIRRVLDEGIADRKTIKSLVRDWRADHNRI